MRPGTVHTSRLCWHAPSPWAHREPPLSLPSPLPSPLTTTWQAVVMRWRRPAVLSLVVVPRVMEPGLCATICKGRWSFLGLP
jgi:hypothetical protein